MTELVQIFNSNLRLDIILPMAMRVNRAEADGANESGQSLELEQIFSSCPGPIEANWSFPEKPPVLLQLSRFNPLQAPFLIFS